MDESRVVSQGFNVGRWHIPPFTLRGGACISLCFTPEAIDDRDTIVAALTGMEPVSGLTLHGSVVHAEPAHNGYGWFVDPTPFDWMKERTSLSDDAIESFLRENGIDRRIPLSHYAGTPRLAMGLAAAYARKPGVILFSTVGLDPRGAHETFQVVAKHLPECAAILLAWPIFSQGQQYHDFFPGSVCVSIKEKKEFVASANAGVPSNQAGTEIGKTRN